MGNIQEYKCPCCGGAIHFDSTIQKMKCPYCDTEFEMEALQGYDEALNQEQPDEMVWDTSAGVRERQMAFTPISASPAAARLLEMRAWQHLRVHIAETLSLSQDSFREH